MIAHNQHKSKPVDPVAARQLYVEIKSIRKVAQRLDSNYQAVRRALQDDTLTSVNSSPSTALQRREYTAEPISAPQRIENAPTHPSALSVHQTILTDHEARLQLVEAALVTLQHEANASERTLSASAHQRALERTAPPQWVNRGTHLAADMVHAIDAYARQHRLEKREVLDLALRTFFAQVTTEEGER